MASRFARPCGVRARGYPPSRRASTSCSFSSSQPPSGPPRRLIIPGQEGAPSGPSGRGPRSRSPQKPPVPTQLEDVSVGKKGSMGAHGNFRLPSNFMERSPGDVGARDGGAAAPGMGMGMMSTEDMLAMLRDQSDYWYNLAPVIVHLRQGGVDSYVIEEHTGVTAIDQNSWVVAGDVHASLVNAVDPEILDVFSQEDGNHLLYPLRMLQVGERITVAKHIAASGEVHDGAASEAIVRAFREMRRKRPRGFNLDSCGDALAYKFLKDAQEETRDEDRRISLAERGLELADSDSARAALNRLLEEHLDEEQEHIMKMKKVLPVVGLDVEELDTCMLCVAGSFDTIDAAQLDTAGRSMMEDVFGTVTASKQGEKWVSLPMYTTMVRAKDPVAVFIEDGHTLSKFGSESNQPAMLVVDRAINAASVRTTGVDPELAYLCPSQTSPGVDLVLGSELVSEETQAYGVDDILAVALIACKPPLLRKDDGDAVVRRES